MSTPAAAAASSSTTAVSSNTSRKRSLAGSDQLQSTGKKQKLDPYICPVCTEPFEFPQSNELIRVLGKCPHNLCHTCLVGHINSKNDRTKMQCPLCRHPYPLWHPERKTDAESLASTFLTLQEHCTINKRNEAVSQVLSPSNLPNNLCTAIGCQAVATHNCLVCKLLCERHNTQALQRKPNHSHMAIADLEKEEEFEKEQKEVAAKKRLEGLEDVRKQLILFHDQLILNTFERKQKEEGVRVVYLSEIEAIESLQNFLSRRMAQLEELDLEVLASSSTLDKMGKDLSTLISVKKREQDSVERSSPDTILRMSDETIQSVTSVSSEIVSAFNQIKEEEKLITFHKPDSSFTNLRNQLKDATLLPNLTKAQRKKLNQFLSLLDAAELVYKASWNGWNGEDCIHCCGGKSDLLFLIQAAGGNSYVSGAYIAPKVNAPVDDDDHVVVPDPTLQSFLFSLTNEFDHSFRLSLTNPNSAIEFTSGTIAFGEEATDDNPELCKFPNMILFMSDRPGNDPRAHCCNHHKGEKFSYRTQTIPQGVELDFDTLSGSEYFGANEIEVYQI